MLGIERIYATENNFFGLYAPKTQNCHFWWKLLFLGNNQKFWFFCEPVVPNELLYTFRHRIQGSIHIWCLRIWNWAFTALFQLVIPQYANEQAHLSLRSYKGPVQIFFFIFYVFFFKTMPKKTLNNDFTTLLPDFEEKLLKNLNEPS